MRAPGSLAKPSEGLVLIEHLSVTGRNDRIERPVDEAVPLFWRFMIEKFVVGPGPFAECTDMPLVAGRATEGALAANLAVWLWVNVSRYVAYRLPRGRVGWSSDLAPPWFSSSSLP